MEEFLTVREVSKRFRLSQNAVINKLRDGKLKGIKVGGTWRLYSAQFEEVGNESA